MFEILKDYISASKTLSMKFVSTALAPITKFFSNDPKAKINKIIKLLDEMKKDKKYEEYASILDNATKILTALIGDGVDLSSVLDTTLQINITSYVDIVDGLFNENVSLFDTLTKIAETVDNLQMLPIRIAPIMHTFSDIIKKLSKPDTKVREIVQDLDSIVQSLMGDELSILTLYDNLVKDLGNESLPIYDCFLIEEFEIKEYIVQAIEFAKSTNLKPSEILGEQYDSYKKIKMIFTENVKANDLLEALLDLKIDFKQLNSPLSTVANILEKYQLEAIASYIKKLNEIVKQKGNDITVKEILSAFDLDEYYVALIKAINLFAQNKTLKEIIEVIKFPFISLSQTINNIAALTVPSFANIAKCFVAEQASTRKTLAANSIMDGLVKAIQALTKDQNATIKIVCENAGVKAEVITNAFSSVDKIVLSTSAATIINENADKETKELIKSMSALTSSVKEGKVTIEVVSEVAEAADSYSKSFDEKPEAKPEKSHTGLIIGLVIGGVALLAIIGFLIWYMKGRESDDEEQAAQV